MSKLSNVFMFAVGAGLGMAAGLLTAPRSGKKTRKQLIHEFEVARDALEERAAEKIDEAKRYINDQVTHKAKSSKEIIDKAKENLTMS